MPSRQDQRLLDSLNRPSVHGIGSGSLAFSLFLLRVFCGFKMLQFALAKWPLLSNPTPMKITVTQWAGDQTHPFWGWQELLKQIVVPHIGAFTTGVTLGELIIGIALLIGLCTRLAAFGTLLLKAAHWLSTGIAPPSSAGLDEALFLIALVLLICRAGRIAGVDAALARQWPRSPLW